MFIYNIYIYISYIAVSFSGRLCQYDNQIFGTNQSIITSDCQEKCRCSFLNGVTITTCKPLCKDEEDPKCDPHSQVIEEYQKPLNATSCTCTGKKCVAGLLLLFVGT